MAQIPRRDKLLKRAGLVMFMGACAMLTWLTPADAVLVDHFTSGPLDYYLTSTPADLSRTSLQPGLADVLGGERDVTVTVSPFDQRSVHVLLFNAAGGFFSVNGDSSMMPLAVLTYPGLGGTQLPGSGLFVEFLGSDLAGDTMTFTAIATNLHAGYASQVGTTGSAVYFFPYTSFGGTITPADFTSVGLSFLQFSIQSVTAQDYVLDAIESGDNIPEPLTMLGMFIGVGTLGAYIRKRRMA